MGAGLSYAFGDVTVGGAWSRSIQTGLVNADSGAVLPSAAFSNYELDAVWQVTPAVWLASMYAYTHASSAHWHEGALQAGYQLSKRTDLYSEAVYQRASSGTPAVINSIDPSSSRNQVLVATGTRHRFSSRLHDTAPLRRSQATRAPRCYHRPSTTADSPRCSPSSSRSFRCSC